ncbi:MAG: hypothetical protein HPY71_12175 [Firmicutes bacterium]|nr:hypothetical protein [Bacillota bacterium]
MKKEYLVGLLVALFLAVIVSPFASPSPDGLERVAEDHGFIQKAEGEPVISSPIPDYALPGIKNGVIATSVAGFTGTVVVFGLIYFLFGQLMKPRMSRSRGHGSMR